MRLTAASRASSACRPASKAIATRCAVERPRARSSRPGGPRLDGGGAAAAASSSRGGGVHTTEEVGIVTLEMFLASVVVGLFAAWLAGVVMKKGGYGLVGDLSLGLAGSTLAVWIF